MGFDQNIRQPLRPGQTGQSNPLADLLASQAIQGSQTPSRSPLSPFVAQQQGELVGSSMAARQDVERERSERTQSFLSEMSNVMNDNTLDMTNKITKMSSLALKAQQAGESDLATRAIQGVDIMNRAVQAEEDKKYKEKIYNSNYMSKETASKFFKEFGIDFSPSGDMGYDDAARIISQKNDYLKIFSGKDETYKQAALKMLDNAMTVSKNYKTDLAAAKGKMSKDKIKSYVLEYVRSGIDPDEAVKQMSYDDSWFFGLLGDKKGVGEIKLEDLFGPPESDPTTWQVLSEGAVRAQEFKGAMSSMLTDLREKASGMRFGNTASEVGKSFLDRHAATTKTPIGAKSAAADMIQPEEKTVNVGGKNVTYVKGVDGKWHRKR